jgi:hypothetical protein
MRFGLVGVLVLCGVSIAGIGLTELAEEPCTEGHGVYVTPAEGNDTDVTHVQYRSLSEDSRRIFRRALARTDDGEGEYILHPADRPADFESPMVVEYNEHEYRVEVSEKWWGCPPNYGAELVSGGAVLIMFGVTLAYRE